MVRRVYNYKLLTKVNIDYWYLERTSSWHHDPTTDPQFCRIPSLTQSGAGFYLSCPPHLHSHHARAACVRVQHSPFLPLGAMGFSLPCLSQRYSRHARAACVRVRHSPFLPLGAKGSSLSRPPQPHLRHTRAAFVRPRPFLFSPQ